MACNGAEKTFTVRSTIESSTNRSLEEDVEATENLSSSSTTVGTI